MDSTAIVEELNAEIRRLRAQSLSDSLLLGRLITELGRCGSAASLRELHDNREVSQQCIDELEWRLSALSKAVDFVLTTFKRDEAHGFTSRDRQFAIAILERATMVEPLKARPALVDYSNHRRGL
jgi:hypothetical protein